MIAALTNEAPPGRITEILRPSALPKLAQCARYVPQSKAGPYAERGNQLDAAFRALMAGKEPETLFPEDREAVQWGVDMTRFLAKGSPILSAKDECRMTIPGLPNGGEADAVVPEQLRSMDAKSGLIRDYREQQAAYALGLMDKHFASEWTTYLLFLDQREAVPLHFTYQQALDIVNGVLASASAPDSVATPGEACGWCALKEVCQARLNLAAEAMAVLQLREGFESIKSEPDKIAAFLVACKPLKDLYEEAREYARDHFFAKGRIVPGFKLQTRKGNEYVAPGDVAAAFPKHSPAELAQLFGNLSAEKFRQEWSRVNGTEPPPNVILSAQSSTFITKAAAPKPSKALK